MVDQYIGEIRLFSGDFAPRGWFPCDGRLLPVIQYQALFSTIGSEWGGDGRTNFALPDLRGRVPVGSGQGTGLTERKIGQYGGEHSVTLRGENFPTHRHALIASTAPATSAVPGPGLVYAKAASPASPSPPKGLPYVADNSGLTLRRLADDTLSFSSNSPANYCSPHANIMPTINITFIISATGLYPSFT